MWAVSFSTRAIAASTWAVTGEDRERRQGTKAGNQDREPRQEIKIGNEDREPRQGEKTDNGEYRKRKDKDGEKRE